MWQILVRLTGAKFSYQHASNFKLQDINLLSTCRQQSSSKSRYSSTNIHGDKSKTTVDLIIEAPSPQAAEWEYVLWKYIHRSSNDAARCNIKKIVVRAIRFSKQSHKYIYQLAIMDLATLCASAIAQVQMPKLWSASQSCHVPFWRKKIWICVWRLCFVGWNVLCD
jgi:hypothetical protein